jgi:hypothetical protein
LEAIQYPLLAVSGLPSFFAKVTVAVPYLLDQFHLPTDLFHLFLLSGIINGHVSSMVGAMHLFAFTAIAAAAVTGRARFHGRRTVVAIAATVVLVVISTVATRSYIELTPALVVPDYVAKDFDTVDELVRAKDLSLGVANDKTILRLVERRLPNAHAIEIPRVAAYFEAEARPTDGLVISAEAGSAWTLI